MKTLISTLSILALTLTAISLDAYPLDAGSWLTAAMVAALWHVHGFLGQYQHRPEIEIVAVVEPDAKLRSAAARRSRYPTWPSPLDSN